MKDDAKLITAFENLKSDLLESNKSLAKVEAELTTCLNSQANTGSTGSSTPTTNVSDNNNSTGVPGDNPPADPIGSSNGGGVPQDSQKDNPLLHFFKTLFHNLLIWFR